MSKIVQLVKKGLRPVVNDLSYKTYFKHQVEDKTIFMESRNGRDIAGNILYLLLEIKRNYKDDYQITLAYRKDSLKHITQLLKEYSITNVKLVKYGSIQYFNILHTSKFLVNDTTFPERFIKQEGQVYLNTWHGTPLKHMGKDSIPNIHLMNNVQRNLLMSDYLLFPSQYCQDKMVQAYCLDGIYKGAILQEGYPRNSIFFDERKREATRLKYNLVNKKIYVYMPTYRESNSQLNSVKQKETVIQYLQDIDQCLKDNEIFYVKLHYYISQDIDFSSYKHIVSFPSDIETYEFLNIADALVSDYSSVFYDYANTRKKVILFKYDQEDYEKNRGMYPQPIDIPFPVVQTPKQLVQELQSPIQYNDQSFIDTYCTYDCIDATQRIFERVFEGEKITKEASIYQDIERVLLYGGGFDINGITTSLLNNISSDYPNKELFACFSKKTLRNKTQNKETINKIDRVLAISGELQMTFFEAIAIVLYYFTSIDNKFVHKYLDRLYKRELKRFFTGTDFSTYIQFVGYERMMLSLFQRANVKKVVYVHNDMEKEILVKGNQLKRPLIDAYKNYDLVAVVSNLLIDGVKRLSGRDSGIVLCENILDDQNVKKRSLESIQVETDTIVSVGKTYLSNNEEDTEQKCDVIQSFMNQHSPLFITMGRFSYEKRHDRLIKAYELIHKENINSGLIIIGGYGDLFEKTRHLLADKDYSDSVMMIQGVRNPMPILKKCDCFVLSSDYEGLGMVLGEADILGVPTISTKAGGAIPFMEQYEGCLVDKDEISLYKAMKRFVEHGIPLLKIDYNEYNKKCRKQFEEMLNKPVKEN